MKIFDTPSRILVTRLCLFVCIQAVLALGFFLAGADQAWEAAAAWWPIIVVITNLMCISLLIWLFKRNGRRYGDIFRIQKDAFKSDWWILLILLVFLGPVGFLPNLLLGKWLFGNPETTLDLMFRPLPFWAVYLSLILFPLTQGLAELPTYFAYTGPEMISRGTRPWLAVSLASLFLALQHVAVPLLFNARFIVWRGLMFLPFAFFVGIVLHWRSRLLPYFVIVHALMDLSLAVMLFDVAF